MASRLPGFRNVSLGGESVALRDVDLDWLLRGLVVQQTVAARSMVEEIRALRLAGLRIELLPTAGELSALRRALTSDEHGGGRMPSALARLLALCEA